MPRWFLARCGVIIAAVALAVVAPHESSRSVRAASASPEAHQSYVETIPGSNVKFEMIAISGGTFVMGSPPREQGRRADEGPAHPVRIQPFWMGKTEVTWDEYDQYWKQEDAAKPEQKTESPPGGVDAVSRPTPPYADETFGHGREGHPVISVTHHAAMEYCRWLSRRTGKLYRLPTEAEWEYACRAGSRTAYFFGDDPKALGDYAWYAANSDDTTHPVSQKKANPWGLHDILGNVAEWCLDRYQKDYAAFPVDRPTPGPVLLPMAERFPHVARGGSWADEPPRLRSAARVGSEKSWIKRDPQRPQSIWWLTDAEFVGFRVVRAVAEQDELKNLRSRVTRESK